MDLAGWFNASVTQKFKGVVASHGRPLVVTGAAAIKTAVTDGCFKWRGIPFAGCWNNIEMGEKTENLFAFAVADHTGGMFDVFGFEAIAGCKVEQII